jgi:hypothetical protein
MPMTFPSRLKQFKLLKNTKRTKRIKRREKRKNGREKRRDGEIGSCKLIPNCPHILQERR